MARNVTVARRNFLLLALMTVARSLLAVIWILARLGLDIPTLSRSALIPLRIETLKLWTSLQRRLSPPKVAPRTLCFGHAHTHTPKKKERKEVPS